jgi:hypothetical protein
VDPPEPGRKTARMTDGSELTALPAFTRWSGFPFEGELRVKPRKPLYPTDRPRDGEPGGGPCSCETETDEAYIWVDQLWRVRPPRERPGVPMKLFLETREHLDQLDFSPELQASYGTMICRLEAAILAIGGVGRVHFSRWGDGGSHFHLWFYARPLGDAQMLGFNLPMWEMIVPPIDETTWAHNLDVVADALEAGGGLSMRR